MFRTTTAAKYTASIIIDEWQYDHKLSFIYYYLKQKGDLDSGCAKLDQFICNNWKQHLWDTLIFLRAYPGLCLPTWKKWQNPFSSRRLLYYTLNMRIIFYTEKERKIFGEAKCCEYSELMFSRRFQSAWVLRITMSDRRLHPWYHSLRLPASIQAIFNISPHAKWSTVNKIMSLHQLAAHCAAHLPPCWVARLALTSVQACYPPTFFISPSSSWHFSASRARPPLYLGLKCQYNCYNGLTRFSPSFIVPTNRPRWTAAFMIKCDLHCSSKSVSCLTASLFINAADRGDPL